MTRRPHPIPATEATYLRNAAEQAAFLASWFSRGGYEGEKALRDRRASPCRLHMPFPHKHCGEW